VILGSALFRDGGIDTDFAERLFRSIGPVASSRRWIVARRVVIHGWRTELLDPTDAVRASSRSWVSSHTHVDRRAMQGTDLRAIERLRAATARRLTAAGGITTMEEVEYLESIGVDAVVGMAIYTGRLRLES
jgi:phosphoribosylformimino-5-aminoimidazole carboxamide ribonucleotide (ProFAR) isomerase